MKKILVYATNDLLYKTSSSLDKNCYTPVLTNINVNNLYTYMISNNIKTIVISKNAIGSKYNILEQLVLRNITVIFVAVFKETGLLRNVLSYDNFVFLRELDINAINTVLTLTDKFNDKISSLDKKMIVLKEKNKETREIFKAKILLMDKLSFTEDKAHKYLQKLSMDRRISSLEAAEEIIKKYN